VRPTFETPYIYITVKIDAWSPYGPPIGSRPPRVEWSRDWQYLLFSYNNSEEWQ